MKRIIVTSLLYWLFLAGVQSGMDRPLRVHPGNPRYWTHDGQSAVYLTGSHTWANVVDIGPGDPPAPFDFEAYLKFLKKHGHNYTRLWTWELTTWNTEQNGAGNRKEAVHRVFPHPWKRVGPGTALDGKPKFDLAQWNPEYFERIRERVKAALEEGVYVSVMLFEGWGMQFSTGAWEAHPFHPGNNVNGINGDKNGDGKGLEVHELADSGITALQEAYVRKVVDAVHEFNNVLFEISNENHPESTEWQYHMIRLIQDYENEKGKRHPVGMTFQYKGGSNETLFQSPADWISPNNEGGYRDNPPVNQGGKAILLDTDHLWGIGGNADWVWKAFLRGHHPIFMDPYDGAVLGDAFDERFEPVREAMGTTLELAGKMDLAAMVPAGDPGACSTRYCLRNPGEEYLAYQPKAGAFELHLEAGDYHYQWFDPTDGRMREHGFIQEENGLRKFTPPMDGAAVLHVAKEKKSAEWDVQSPPGPRAEQAIDADEGTWISLDVRPNGEEIVFDFLGDLYVMPITGADGTGDVYPEKLTEGIAWDMQPRFSPDGEWIAFTSDRTGKSGRGGDNIWVIHRDGTWLRQITDEDFRLLNGPAWKPDGRYIVARKHFTSRRSLGAGEMWLYHAGGVEAGAQAGVQLTKRPNDQKDVNEPVFSPDGRYLYYSQDATPGGRFEYDKDSNKQIYVVKQLDLVKGETESLITGPGGACRPVPSPDGKTLAFVRRAAGKSGLHLFDMESGEVKLVYEDLERDMQEAWAIHGVYPNFAWTPDGQSIVFWAKGKIRRLHIDGLEASIIPFRIQGSRTVTERLRYPVEVAPEEFDVRLLRWVQVSPDGGMAVFQALGHLYLKELPDGEPRRLTGQNEHFEFYPSFSRDGKYVVYTTWDDHELGGVRIASAETGGGQENWKVTEEPGHYVEPVFSPDGKTIVFRKTGGGHVTSPLWSRHSGLYAIPANGGAMERIVENGFNPQFGEDSSRVFFQRRDSNDDADNLSLISTDMNGHEERVHFTGKWATDFAISPDGRRIAFIERFNVHVGPFLQTGEAISIGPGSKALPIKKVSEDAGNFVHFSNDGNRLYWTLGPNLYTQPLAGLIGAPNKGDDESSEQEAVETRIGFRRAHAKPDGTIVLTNGRFITMTDRGVIENGTAVIRGNRIVSVGAVEEAGIPEGAERIDLKGRVVLPGFVDTHAHGSQGSSGIIPERNWVDYARLAFGVTTIHDPSNDTHTIFAASELAKAGLITAPRTFSTGTILYGAAGSYKAEVNSLEDARFHLRRMKAVGAFTVKSYNQPRRDQRQQVLTAARELKMMVVPEGGSTFMHNLTMVVDGHTGVEHTLPVETIYKDVLDLWKGTGVGYTPTLSVAYGGLSGENYWYQHDDLWLHPRVTAFIPPHVIQPRARRRLKAPEADYNHIRVAGIANKLVDIGEIAQAGGHGQLNGLCTHWEMWSFVQGGMTPMEALRCGTLFGAQYLGLDGDLGSIEAGKLADLIVMEAGADPVSDIRDSEKIQYVVANGRLFDAATMNEVGEEPEVENKFYWRTGRYALNDALQTFQVECAGCRR